MMRRSVDLPQPDGPDQRDELARLDREVDALERDRLAVRECLRDALELDDLRRRVMRTCSGARRTMSFSASDDGEEEADSEQRGDDVRRPELLRLDRVVLAEVDDRAAEAALDRGRGLAR